MPPAIVAGGIAAAGAIGGAVIGNKSQKKANAQAAETQNRATDAQLQLGQQSLGLNRDIYNSNYNTLAPFVSRGNVAGNQINAMLGLGAAPTMTSPLGGSPAPAAPAPTPAAPAQGVQGGPVAALGGAPAPQGSALAALSNPATASAPAAGAPAPSAATNIGNEAFNNFTKSAGMDFILDQGADMINNRYAASGALQSGAAMKALQSYGQSTALDKYLMPYMGMLGNQQAVGAGSASSIAGVGANFGNTAANINGQMGNAINNGAQNIGNLQLANGQNNANMWGQIGGALGGFASSF